MAGLIAGGLVAPAPSARAAGVLKVAMTAGDLPVTTVIQTRLRRLSLRRLESLRRLDQLGFVQERQSVGHQAWPRNRVAYRSGEPQALDIHLRQGVKWHDGCDFTADDVVWNFQRISDPKAPQFFTQQFALSRAYLTNFESIEKVDDHSVAITTKFVESLFPYDMSYVLMISRCRAEALHYDWTAYASQPSGTGPYRFVGMTAHERMEMVRTTSIGQGARAEAGPPGAAADAGGCDPHRGAALRPGELHRSAGAGCDPGAEARQYADRLQRLSAQLAVHSELHPRSLHDLRVRQAANYAINRDDVVDLVGGMATPQYAEVRRACRITAIR